jgi:hypothetical protein
MPGLVGGKGKGLKVGEVSLGCITFGHLPTRGAGHLSAANVSGRSSLLEAKNPTMYEEARSQVLREERRQKTKEELFQSGANRCPRGLANAKKP